MNLPGFSIIKISGIEQIVYEVKFNWVLRCAHCNSKRVRKKSAYIRNVNHAQENCKIQILHHTQNYTQQRLFQIPLKHFEICDSLHINYPLKIQ